MTEATAPAPPAPTSGEGKGLAAGTLGIGSLGEYSARPGLNLVRGWSIRLEL